MSAVLSGQCSHRQEKSWKAADVVCVVWVKQMASIGLKVQPFLDGNLVTRRSRSEAASGVSNIRAVRRLQSIIPPVPSKHTSNTFSHILSAFSKAGQVFTLKSIVQTVCSNLLTTRFQTRNDAGLFAVMTASFIMRTYV